MGGISANVYTIKEFNNLANLIKRYLIMMNVILLEKIGRLGNLGDQVNVRPGYARNYLIPQGKAVRATQKNVAEFEARRAELERVAKEKLDAARARAEALAELNITIAARAADEIKLYGSVGTHEIAHAINNNNNLKINKSEIRLPNGPLRQIGAHEIMVQLHSDVIATVKVNIIAEA